MKRPYCLWFHVLFFSSDLTLASLNQDDLADVSLSPDKNDSHPIATHYSSQTSSGYTADYYSSQQFSGSDVQSSVKANVRDATSDLGLTSLTETQTSSEYQYYASVGPKTFMDCVVHGGSLHLSAPAGNVRFDGNDDRTEASESSTGADTSDRDKQAQSEQQNFSQSRHVPHKCLIRLSGAMKKVFKMTLESCSGIILRAYEVNNEANNNENNKINKENHNSDIQSLHYDFQTSRGSTPFQTEGQTISFQGRNRTTQSYHTSGINESITERHQSYQRSGSYKSSTERQDKHFTSTGVSDKPKQSNRSSLALNCHSWFPPRHVFSDSSVVWFELSMSGNISLGQTSFNLRFEAVDKSVASQHQLQLFSTSPLRGFLQTPNWDGTTQQYPPLMKSCVTVTAPNDHVIFLSFLRVSIFGQACKSDTPDSDSEFVALYDGSCSDRSKMVWKHCSMNRPDPYLHPEPSGSLSLYFVSNDVSEPESFGFRAQFSFHNLSSKPKQVRRKWNCSVEHWKDFKQHFSCDLFPQCFAGEDEEHCPYTTSTCGPGFFEVSGKCYLYAPRRGTISWEQAFAKCADRGMLLASLETHQEWNDVIGLISRHADFTLIHLGLRTTESTVPQLYRRAWMWNSKVIAYFASVAGMAKLPGCAALPSPQFRYENPLVTMPNFTLRLIDCKTRYKSTYVCEPPPSRLLNPNRPLLKFVPSSENARIKILSPSIAIVPVKATAKSSEAASKFDGHTTQSTIPGATSDLVHSTVFSLHKEALSGHTALSSLLTPISSTDSVVSSGYATISSEGNKKTSSSSRKSPIEVVACPNGHVTHAFLACDVDSACWSASSQEQCVAPVTPLPPMFRCKNGVDSVPYTMLCDSRADCRDSSDEDFCDFPSCTGDKPYSCGSGGQCFNWRQKCDGTYDCVDGSDESCCGVSFLVVRQFRSPPPPGRIEIDYIVNVIALTSTLCPKGHFQCPGNGYCLPIHFICNGIKDCPGMEDETACDSYTCSGLYRCRGSRMCVELREVCDDKYEPRCPQSDDELLCDLSCPANCTCRGLAFFCAGKFPVGDHPSLRFLEARGSGLSLGEVVNNTELVHLGLAACGIRNLSVILLPRIHSVDLSDNHLSVLSLQYFQRLRHLRELILSGNPFTSSTPADAFSPLRGFRPLRSLDLSRTLLNFLHKEVIQVFTDIKVLNVSHSRLSTLQGLEELKSLEELDLRGCKLTNFQAGILQNILNLERLYADNPKMCCPAALPDGFDLKQCFAPTDDISSCDALLRSNIYRVVLAIFAVLALLGNLVSFIFRVRLPPTAKKLGFNVFVTQLCLSDFLMGVYLAMIGVADQLYLGSYVWQDEAWKMSTACKVAGFLSLLSSETSALIVCLITVERFLVLHFPFSRLHFKDRSAYLASSVAWGTGLVLASLPLMPATQHWRFYSQTGICLPLPVTGADFPGHGYSFGVMIVCNLVLCLLIGVGQCFIYWSVKSNTMAPMAFDATRKTSDAAIARRLLTVVMSNFLCWFPIGLCGVMSSNGYPIPGEVNVAMAIFVLPLNSALNPFLYTLNIILERREKRREERLKKFLISEIKSDRLNRQ